MHNNAALKLADLEQQITFFVPCVHNLDSRAMVYFDPAIELQNINSIESANFNIKMLLQTLCEENRLEIASIYLANRETKKASEVLAL